jgi:uncharacterized delta-60 repeat protein
MATGNLGRVPNGITLDTTFDSDGMVDTDFCGIDEASALAIDSNGKIVIGGAGGANGDVIAARYNTDGSVDTSYSGDGKAYAEFGGNDEGEDMALDSSGRLVIVGSTDDLDMLVVRFNTDGTLDPRPQSVQDRGLFCQ